MTSTKSKTGAQTEGKSLDFLARRMSKDLILVIILTIYSCEVTATATMPSTLEEGSISSLCPKLNDKFYQPAEFLSDIYSTDAILSQPSDSTRYETQDQMFYDLPTEASSMQQNMPDIRINIRNSFTFLFG